VENGVWKLTPVKEKNQKDQMHKTRKELKISEKG